MGITQKEIAKNLGVSFMTVSRVLNNSNDYVSDHLRKKILDYAKEMGYEPHRASQVLVRNTKRHIALFSSSLPKYFWEEINKGVQIAANQIKAFDYTVRYHQVPELDTGAYLALIKQELKQGVDAIALVNQRMYDMDKIIALISDAQVPYIFFNIDSPADNRMSYVGSDYRDGGRLAANFLATTLQLAPSKEVLVLQATESQLQSSHAPDINKLRLDGFVEFVTEKCTDMLVHVEYFDSLQQDTQTYTQIFEIIQRYHQQVSAIYLIPAFNTEFLSALKEIPTANVITVLHDLDSTASSYLKSRRLSAVIDQSPTLQGYYTVMTLEKLLERGPEHILPFVKVDHNLVLSENRQLIHGLIEGQFLI